MEVRMIKEIWWCGEAYKLPAPPAGKMKKINSEFRTDKLPHHSIFICLISNTKIYFINYLYLLLKRIYHFIRHELSSLEVAHCVLINLLIKLSWVRINHDVTLGKDKEKNSEDSFEGRPRYRLKVSRTSVGFFH